MASSTKDELTRLIKLLVDEPDEVEVFEEPDGDEIVFFVEVAEEDLGKVIGRQGRTARALRSLLAARAERDGELYDLEIVDD